MDERPRKPRRLELMPEVLPPPPQPGKLSPRERTLKSLGRLAAVAATAAAIGACKETGCGSGGYAVVDPMPPPAQCDGLVATISPSASWDPSGNIVLRLSKPTMAGAAYVLPGTGDASADASSPPAAGTGDAAPESSGPSPSSAASSDAAAQATAPTASSPGALAGAIRVQRGTLVSAVERAGALVVVVSPESTTTTYVSVEVPASCPAGSEQVQAEIRLEHGAEARPKLSVALYDGR
ncbi:MAG: hypothetical protein R3B89_22815 [Polyangiaceae bacterium]